MDTNRLADILRGRLIEHLGPEVDYAATVLPDVLGLQVVMIRPAYFRGFTFQFQEHEQLPLPIRGMIGGLPRAAGWERFDQPIIVATNPGPLHFDLNTRTIREATVAPLMRTREQEAYYQNLSVIAGRREFTPLERRDWDNLTVLAPFVEPAPLARTPEQEARFQDLEARAREEAFTDPILSEYRTLAGLAPCPTPIAPRIIVRVHRNNYDWQVTIRVGANSRDLPTIAIIKSLLNPADKHYLPSRQGRYRSTLRILQQSLAAGLPAQSLHDALRAWVMAMENQVTTAESTMPVGGIDQATANLLRAQPATLEVGGLVYKLVPCHQTDVRPLIARVRAKALAGANVEATAVRERASVDARVTVTEAERKATAIRREAELALRQAGQRIPDWVKEARRPHYWSGSYWCVEMRVSCLLRDIRLTISRLNTIIHWTPLVIAHPGWGETDYYNSHKMPVWLRLGADGAYDMHSIYTREWRTTHIAERGCMELQGIPRVIDSVVSLTNLERAVERGMNIINLNSPLSTDYYSYYPDYQAQIPKTVAEWLRGEIGIDPPIGRTLAWFREQHPNITWDSLETIQEEEMATFSVDTPPVPVVRPPEPTVDEIIANGRAILAAADTMTGIAIPDIPIVVRRRNA